MNIFRTNLEWKGSRRKFRNYQVAPASQYRAALLIFGVVFGVTTVLFSRLIASLSDILLIMGTMAPKSPELAQMTAQARSMLYLNYWVLIAAMFFSTLFIVLFVTHRYVGPIVQIQRHVQKLFAGDFDSQIRLREDDEFHDLAVDLNALAKKMKSGGVFETGHSGGEPQGALS